MLIEVRGCTREGSFSGYSRGIYLHSRGLILGSVVWDATGGWSCDEITSLLRAPAEARVIGYSTWMGLVPVGW